MTVYTGTQRGAVYTVTSHTNRPRGQKEAYTKNWQDTRTTTLPVWRHPRPQFTPEGRLEQQEQTAQTRTASKKPGKTGGPQEAPTQSKQAHRRAERAHRNRTAHHSTPAHRTVSPTARDTEPRQSKEKTQTRRRRDPSLRSVVV